MPAQRDCLLVVQKNDHSLGCYDLERGDELARVALDPFPHELALSPDRRFAYVTHFGVALAEDPGPGGNTVSVVDLAAMRRCATLDCGDDRRPHGIDVDGAGRVLVLSEMRSTLLRFEGGDLSPRRRRPTGGRGSHYLRVTRDGTRAFCSNMLSGTVSLVSPDADTEPRVWPVGERPEGSTFDEEEALLYVVNRESASISVIDTGAARLLRPIATRPGPVRICCDAAGRLLVGLYHAAALARIDPRRPARQEHLELPGRPVSVAFAATRQEALLGLLGDRVCVVDTGAMRIRRCIATRAGPDPVACLRLAL